MACFEKKCIIVTAVLLTCWLTTASSLRFLYGEIGRSFEMRCLPVSAARIRYDVVAWRLNGSAMDNSSDVFTQSTLLRLKKVALSNRGEYSCHDASTGRELDRIAFKPGYPPHSINVTCRSKDYLDCLCTFHLNRETFLPTNYTAVYGDKSFKDCLTESKDSCLIRNVYLFTVEIFTLTVTAVNDLGSTNNTATYTDNIVQPDPPENVTAHRVKNAKSSIIVTWKEPSTWNTVMQLKYEMDYKPNQTSSWQTVELNENNFTITDAHQGGEPYVVRVHCHDVFVGRWSEWSPQVYVGTQQVFGVLGSEVTLKCGFPEDTMGGQFVWTLNGSGLTPNSDVTLRQNRLTLNNASAQYAGSYSCSPAGTNDVVDYILLNLGSMPKTATIQCRAVNYNHFKCVWSNENNINFKAQYRFVGNDTVVECTLLGGGNVCIGAWPGSPSPTLELHVSASNSFGVTNSSVQLQLKTVLRPEHPVVLRSCPSDLAPRPSSPSVCVRWAAPASWRLPEVFPLQYRLRFNVSHVVEVSGYNTYSYTLTCVAPCIQYAIQVAARDAANNGEWSEWSQPITLPCNQATSVSELQFIILAFVASLLGLEFC
uniref:Uncharacterized protein LOC116940372 n=1 Tax=Petromyzon marinus TaxID=7757 RepID=A0AAJ7SWG3_PETMA|nr:uncharacterized protein LOC116940372 [Petromyzon marinus]